jgi:hypothetical protein
MNGYNFDSVRFQTQEHLDHRAREAASERLARQCRSHAEADRPAGRASLTSRVRRQLLELPALRLRLSS